MRRAPLVLLSALPLAALTLAVPALRLVRWRREAALNTV